MTLNLEMEIIRKRFDDATIHRLLEVKWWNWTNAEIEEMLPLLLSADLDTFIARAKEKAGRVDNQR